MAATASSSRFTFAFVKPIAATAAFLISPPKPRKISRGGALKSVRSVEAAENTRPKSDSGVDMQRLVDFLYEDLPHLFDDRGIDRTAYDERVEFSDPITKHDGINGYLFNIFMLKKLFGPDFQLHWVKQTGPYEITTRWTMVMRFALLPWRPEVVFTGTSVMGVNPVTNKFCSHVDYWDSIDNNDYFSLEGLMDLIKQLRYYKTPELEMPEYRILKRTANYEIRKYEPFMVAEASSDKLSGSKGFNSVAGYIFGKNSTNEKIPMTAPVFTHSDSLKVSIQIVLPSGKDSNDFPVPEEEGISLRRVEGGVAAASRFSGMADEDAVADRERRLRRGVVEDGLRPREGCLLARYNDPGRTSNLVMRNEVVIWLEDFSLDGLSK
ncbi:hypothetical protein M569_10235 [Genlisea aurea]|uniref:SOUL heme-binding protein n=1 Tax=Genlisea aurea TaxID=192259 RepID=S8DX64_9LAMI|nr:hypothetical protein M569_10235 [Genlisea aurea]